MVIIGVALRPKVQRELLTLGGFCTFAHYLLFRSTSRQTDDFSTHIAFPRPGIFSLSLVHPASPDAKRKNSQFMVMCLVCCIRFFSPLSFIFALFPRRKISNAFFYSSC